MSEKNVASATAYYQAMNDKDLSVIEKYLHPEVRLISPLADITGKEAVFNSVKHFLAVFNKLTIRAHCGSEDQVMLAYDLDCSAPFGLVRGAVLLNFQEDLIIRYELFYDARPFEKKRDEIFMRESSTTQSRKYKLDLNMANIKATIFFDKRYWEGYAVAKHIFGAEPADPEVYEFVLNSKYEKGQKQFVKMSRYV